MHSHDNGIVVTGKIEARTRGLGRLLPGRSLEWRSAAPTNWRGA